MFFNQFLKSLTKTEKIFLYCAIAVFFIASLLWFSYFINKNTVAVPVESGTYTEGVVGQPKFINPIISNTDTDRDLSQIVYSDLTELMDRYTVDAEGKTWNVFLKSDLLWSDDKPLTSDDVIFTIETIQDPEARSPLFTTWQGIIANRISELEIEFTLRNQYVFFLDNLKDLKIIPKHIFGSIPSSNLKLSNYNLEPVGSGPYKYVNYNLRSDGFITQYNFAINPNYAGKKAFIRELSIKFFQGAEELTDSFNSRKIDGFGNLSPKNIEKIKISNKLVELKMPRYYAIFMNQNMNEALKEKTVRQALDMATDKNKIINELFGGKAEIVNQPITSTIEGYKNMGSGNFSIEGAEEILEKEGWKANQETGIREKKSGKNTIKLELQLIVPQIQFLSDAADLIKTDWEKIGIKLDLIKLNPADINEDVIKNRNYQMLMLGNILKNNPDIFSFWHSSEKFYPGLNLSMFQNKKADESIEAIRKEMDVEKRIGKIGDLQNIIKSESPAIFLFSPYYLYASIKNLSGLEGELPVTPSDRFKNVNEWYLETSRVLK
ncbi:MAG: peptide ABC transporter substrate-binding protein [bacterium]|nr:peptide ABC transporter substrate-binding protein [bacterium]